jgi:L-2-hydroxyglutarate oxidase LhgO
MVKDRTDFECVVVGAGILGLSVARSISKRNKKVLVLEKNRRFGEETSSRNSGVIHAGIYYPKKSLKSIFCVKGNSEIYSFAKKRGIHFNKCGKLIVANNPSEEKILLKIKKNASKNGISLLYINNKKLKTIEPNLNCFSALYSETSGVIDSHDLMTNFVFDIESKKGELVFGCKVNTISIEKEKIKFSVNKNNFFTTKVLINCSGLESHLLAKKIKQLNKSLIPKIKFVKGSYMKLTGKSPFKKLIYPVPTQNGLGIHSTLNIEGQTIFGPDDEIVKKINYNVSEEKKEKFINSIKKFWPEISKDKITCDYSGIRTKVKKNDFIIQDYNDHHLKGLINLFGMDSPGLTSSIPIGEYVANKCIYILNNL